MPLFTAVAAHFVLSSERLTLRRIAGVSWLVGVAVVTGGGSAGPHEIHGSLAVLAAPSSGRSPWWS